ncbi:MAG: hypothetical protein COZ21_10285 [Bacteroidetes bacterium CG_4_10_14_3_um_filter_31_20]|nr:MAG: hypothetical protein COZ21_10285 [Bacteroidetes bacterium CG_4_10_14_3_um_filter_31_20]
MKKIIFLGLAFVAFISDTPAQEFKVITTVESIVPMGIGRSRMIDNKQPMDYKKFTTERTGGKDSNQGKVDRTDAKIDNMEETKLLNFYSGVGINFQNIASNDAIIGSKLNEMAKEGWELMFVTSGVESDSGKDDGKGIFITRYVFRKK